MAGYIIIDFEITDPEGFREHLPEYMRLASPSLQKYGGRPIVGGAVPEPLEGDRHPHEVAIGEFESVEQAIRWYTSEEYAPAKTLRSKFARYHTVAAQGVQPH